MSAGVLIEFYPETDLSFVKAFLDRRGSGVCGRHLVIGPDFAGGR